MRGLNIKALISRFNAIGLGEIHRAAGDNGGNRVFVHHLRHGISQQNDVLVKRLDLALLLDAVDQINGNRHMLFAQYVEKRVL